MTNNFNGYGNIINVRNISKTIQVRENITIGIADKEIYYGDFLETMKKIYK